MSIAIVPTAWQDDREVVLPAVERAGAVSLVAAMRARRSVRAFGAGGLSLADLGRLMWAAQGITGAEGTRTAPSAGALYPLGIYAAAGSVEGVEAAIYRYVAAVHRLAPVRPGDRRRALAEAARQEWIAAAAAVLVVAAVPERTTAKYGGRGRRYVDLEAGHAAQNVCLMAASLGLGGTVVGAFRDAEVAEIVGLAADEAPLCLLPVGPPADGRD